MLDATRLRELLCYDPDTGIFTRRKSKGGRASGSVAGSIHRPSGYQIIGIGGRGYKAHRLAWLYVHNRFPPEDLDHINGVRTDNRIANLREASRSQNNANRRAKNGVKGVTFRKLSNGEPRWLAQIQVGGVNRHLGCFATQEAAQSAYAAAARAEFGEYARAA